MEGSFNSHSRTLSSKKGFHNNVNGFTAYDDVFGGPPKFGVTAFAPRADDYSEIFGSFHSSRASSIPILDLPAVDDAVVSFDVRSSNFDYAEVFSGFPAVDFATPFNELFKHSDGGDDVDGGSSEEAWTPVGTVSPSEESDPSAYFGKNHCFQNEAIAPSVDSKQFNVSYHRVDLGAREAKSNMIRVTQLNAVPGYSYVVDEVSSLQKIEQDGFYSQATDKIILSEDSSGNISEENYVRKIFCHPSHNGMGIQSFDRDQSPGRAHYDDGSPPNPTFISVSDVSLRTQPSTLPAPSRPPPILVDRKGDSSRLNSDSSAPKSCISEVTVDEISSHFFDVDVDGSSSAAASAVAMKEAMEKAQAKLETVKQVMLRRKDGPQCSSKPGMQNDINVVGDEKMIIDDECLVKDTRQQETHGVEHNDRRSSGKGSQGAQKDKSVLPHFEQSANVAGKPPQRKHKKKHSFFVDPISTEGTGEWKKAMQYYEFINNDNSSLATQLPIYEEYLVQGTNVYQPGSKDGKVAAFELQEDGDERIKATRKTREKGNNTVSTNSMNGAYEPEENRWKLKATKAASRQEYHEKMVKVAQAVHDTVICEHLETERRLKGASETNEHEKKLETQDQLAKHRRIDQALQRAGSDHEKCPVGQEEKDRIFREAVESEEEENKVNEVSEGEDNERRSEALEREENMSRVKEAFEREEIERNIRIAVKQKEEEKKPEKTFELEEYDKGCKEDIQEEGGKRTKEVLATEGYAVMEAWEEAQSGRNLEQAVGLPGSDKISKEAAEVEECKKHDDLGEEKNWNWPDESHEPAANDKKLEEVQERDEDEKKVKRKLEQEDFDKKSMLPCELENTGREHAFVSEQEEHYGVSKDELQIMLEGIDEEPPSCSEMGLNLPAEFLKSSTEACSPDERFVEQADRASKPEKPQKKAYAAEQEPPNQGIGKIRTGHGEEEMNALKVEDMLIDERTESTIQDNAKNKIQEIEASESVYKDNKTTKSERICVGDGKTPEEEEGISNSSPVEEVNHGEGGSTKTVGEAQVFLNQEKDKDRSGSTQEVNVFNEIVRQTEPDQPLMLERKESIQKRSQPPDINQTTERKVKITNENFASQEKEKAERLKRERELESDRLRKLEEEREREREREKDRMAVDVATGEAHERAERAAVEKATAEARQRAMAEARERLERACAEAREKSEKASMEARLRAERALVERVTAEARERAIAKAIAERANFEARGRVERSVSDKFSSYSREMGMGQSSSFCNTEKLDGGGGESAQRCKARLERHRRTVERVAKALAEKNMRDLLVQREQAERNRLAETLDADIKRWSSGKEGNLRALLSTLQYILGPDSGWQPVPLTEVITAAAVKKAYRKATLCVHPDKLQQRGASTQQKYICEKVFDLLKDAWNKFNSEER